MEVQRTLVLSTAHLTDKDTRRLDNWEDPDNPHPVPYGYRMYVGSPRREEGWDSGLGLDNWTTPLRPIVDLAHEHDCTYVLFDRDGDVHPLLESFEW